jgi:membrane associated rhomboid family serine protease
VILIPVRDENPTRHRAWVTLGLVVLNVAAFAGQLVDGSSHLVQEFGFIPADGLADAPRVFGSMFLHGGFLHLIGNLIYLWIFGNNVEDVLGPVRYLGLYLLSGVAGHAAHLATNVGSMVPTIGASGAISGLLAAYLIRFPRAKVQSLLLLFVFLRWVRLPAAIVIGYWLVLQVINGAADLGGGPGGGVAWFEHLGGFAAGALLFPLLAAPRRA